jgi:hypothetical protein
MLRDPQKHRIKAERNEQFADQLDKTDPIRESWAVVAAFYSALHYVDQFFAQYGTPCEKHKERNDQFKRDARIKLAYARYSYLSDLSHQARYKVEALPDKAYEKLARPQLVAVKKQIDHALQLEAKPAAPTTVRSVTFPDEVPKPIPGNPKNSD